MFVDKPQPCTALVLCQASELSYQIKREFQRIIKLMKDICTEVIYGGQSIDWQSKLLKSDKATQIMLGTTGRIFDLTIKKASPMKTSRFLSWMTAINSSI
jgi:superfamily II DNA/RNA helicase